MSDKFFANVKILAGFNGVDGATSYSEESSGRVASFAGNAQLDTAQVKFGTASALFDGTGDQITFPDSADYTLGTSDFTIEAWVRFNSVASNQAICSHYNATGNQRAWLFGITTANVLRFGYSSNGSTTSVASVSWTPSVGVWYHVALCRTGGNLYFFVDGALLGTVSIAAASIFNSTATFTVGGQLAATDFLNGWIDELRFTVGTARYTAAFTPPRGPFDRAKHVGQLGDGRQPIVMIL